jgi:hypothetical protein
LLLSYFGKWSSCRFTYSYLVTTFASSIEEISVNFGTGETPIHPITCIAPSSETTTGGVYKWQGRNRHSLMSCAYEIFLVARPIIAILGPKWVDVIPVIPPAFDSRGSDQKVGILVLTDIVVRVSPRTLRSITDLLLPKISPRADGESCREETHER